MPPPQKIHKAPKIYACDKIMNMLWTCDPSQLPPHNGKKTRLEGPLFNLEGLQQMLRVGTLNLTRDTDFWVATNDCWDNLADLKWTPSEELRKAFLLLKPGSKRKKTGDYINSQWAQDSDGDWWPCDAYGVCINERDGFIRAANAPETYIKFSLDAYGSLCLILISCHPST